MLYTPGLLQLHSWHSCPVQKGLHVAIMGGAAAGAMDANAFNAAVRSAHHGVFLPEVSTLTYQGSMKRNPYLTLFDHI